MAEENKNVIPSGNDRKFKYADIINLPHPISQTRPQMDIADRAAQFSPFSALTGHEEAIEESGRLTNSFIELDENRKTLLDERLQWILEQGVKKVDVGINYFLPDERKEGGAYVLAEGRIKRIDEHKRCILMENEKKIPFDMIYEIHINHIK